MASTREASDGMAVKGDGWLGVGGEGGGGLGWVMAVELEEG